MRGITIYVLGLAVLLAPTAAAEDLVGDDDRGTPCAKVAPHSVSVTPSSCVRAVQAAIDYVTDPFEPFEDA